LRMLLSEDPMISQLSITSHSAIRRGQDKFLFIGDALRHFRLIQGGQYFPEPVLRMSVIKALRPRFYRRKASQDQRPGCAVPEWRKFMHKVPVLILLFIEPAVHSHIPVIRTLCKDRRSLPETVLSHEAVPR
jgi:hypothetical protein